MNCFFLCQGVEACFTLAETGLVRCDKSLIGDHFMRKRANRWRKMVTFQYTTTPTHALLLYVGVAIKALLCFAKKARD